MSVTTARENVDTCHQCASPAGTNPTRPGRSAARHTARLSHVSRSLPGGLAARAVCASRKSGTSSGSSVIGRTTVSGYAARTRRISAAAAAEPSASPSGPSRKSSTALISVAASP